MRRGLRGVFEDRVAGVFLVAARERSLWPAAFLVSLGLSESWRVLFGWDPLWLGERAGRAGGAAGFTLGAVVFLASFLLLRALGLSGEMVLVGQVSDFPGVDGPVVTFRRVRGRFLPLALTYLPYELARVAVVYLPSRIVYSWSRWDPRLKLWPLYIFFVGVWGLLILVLYGPASVLARLAVREVVLGEAEFYPAWRESWEKASRSPGRCAVAWLWSLAADLSFLVPGWILVAILPWLGRSLGKVIPVPVVRVIPSVVLNAVLAAALVSGQVLVQTFKSIIWTRTWLELDGALVPGPGWFPDPGEREE
ncbi:MAG: hypothetical protein WHT46_06640 [Candidatus Geothermincolales bacterium]